VRGPLPMAMLSRDSVERSQYSITTRGLTKRFGTTVLAVDGLDLELRPGEIYGLLGPNGAGKTTTLRMLLGLARPTAGSALVAGYPAGSPRSLARVGSLVEAPAFWPYLSGADNLRAVAAYVGVGAERVTRALASVDLEERAHDRFGIYSMGMRQRLGVAAALLKDPEVLILDEPTNGLDPAGMIEMRDLIRTLRTGHRTVLLSSHLLHEVEQVCDRVGVIQSGRLIAEGTIEELRGEGRLVVRAAPADRAQAVLREIVGPDRVTGQDGLFQVAVAASRTAEINRRLVQADVDVAELRMSERSLEDVFMQLTEEVP
jgi:ABC-type multidrug transport system ATPase subunit